MIDIDKNLVVELLGKAAVNPRLRQNFDLRTSAGERSFREVERFSMDPAAGNFGCVVPSGAWHTVEVLEPSVIFEAKDGRFGEDGSESA